MTRLLAAVAFLTRIPIRRAFEAADVGRSTVFFPLVGAGLGALRAAVFWLASPWLPPLVLAVTLVSVSVWMTRALHHDGLSDLTDGLGGGYEREDALRIMKDPRIGTFGAIAVGLVLLFETAALEALFATASVVPALILTPALARWASLPLSFSLPYGRTGKGVGAALTEHVGKLELAGATVIAAGLVVSIAPRLGALVWAITVAVGLVVGGLARRRLGGVTGDVLGANVVLAETAGFVVAAGVAS